MGTLNTTTLEQKSFAPESNLGERLALLTHPQAYARQRSALES